LLIKNIGKLSNKDRRHEETDLSGGPRIKHSTKEVPFAPDEVLFRRKDAPQRYAEYDIYFSHERDLPRSGRGMLPESDLLKAIHTYSSHYYAASGLQSRTLGGRNADNCSMDETALIAFGILLEEAARDVLGRRGDLIFTEAAESSHASADESLAKARERVAVGMQDVGPRVPLRKRRRVKSPGARLPVMMLSTWIAHWQIAPNCCVDTPTRP
jgi:hypothetical protein